jgi:ketosteroid isomerase-like protein
MNRLLTTLLLAIAGIAIAACGGVAVNAPPANTNAANTNANANANTAKTSAAPSAEALMALEQKASDAWKNKDGKFFDGFLTTNFVGFDDHGRRSKREDVIKMIGESKCEVKTSSMSDPHVTPVGSNVAVITTKVTADYTCGGKPGPSPVTAASVYVKDGDTWKGAYHNEVAVMEPKEEKPDDKKAPPPPPKKEEKKPAANTTAANTTKPANTSANTNAAAKPEDLTATLTALEKAGWEAWKTRDAAKLHGTLTNEITFVDMMGKVTAGQDQVIKNWTEGNCDVKTVDITNSEATEISPGVAILTYKGHASGTCDGHPLMDLWGTTVSVKEGDTWKAAYIFETPMAK